VRIVETCTCGGSIEIIWNSPNSRYSFGQAREEEEAKKQLTTFRKAHKTCLISKAAGS